MHTRGICLLDVVGRYDEENLADNLELHNRFSHCHDITFVKITQTNKSIQKIIPRYTENTEYDELKQKYHHGKDMHGKKYSVIQDENTYELSPQEAATFTRRNLADTLRTRSAYHVNLLLAGYDEDRPQLYYLDYLASIARIRSHALWLWWLLFFKLLKKPGQGEQGYELLKKCVKEVHKRLAINLPNFKVQVIDKDGIKDMPDITLDNLN
ncbi:hypothetical protein NQ317_010462 [Molorchus minor]|uniref:Uncharacterized protein n=1 Tax=Molorchus minor TaxID=1323400 RepID=A0ABQ9JYC7_9CUCU|nr:hypothetical protein NQ317_010462 [Molorchus minor]